MSITQPNIDKPDYIDEYLIVGIIIFRNFRINNQHGVVHFLVLGLLLLGLVAAVYLVQNKQIFKSKASSETVTLTDSNGQVLPKDSSGNYTVSSRTVNVHIIVPN